MKRALSLLLILPFLAACGTSRKDELVPEGPNNRATGRLGGAPWTASSAVARPTSSGYDITVAGSGERISCSSQFPSQAHLSFKAPAQIGRYEFDLANPGSGSSPVFSVFPYVGGADVVISKSSVVEIRSLSGGRVSGGVFAESSQTGNRGGSISGSFEAEICPNAVTPEPIESGLQQLASMNGYWSGMATVERGGSYSDNSVNLLLWLRDEGGRKAVTIAVSDANSRESFWYGQLFVNESGFEQACVPRGSSQPVMERVGFFQPSQRKFSIQLRESDCSQSAKVIEFQQDRDGGLRLFSEAKETIREFNRSVRASRLNRL